MRKRSKFIIAAVAIVGFVCLAISLGFVSLYGENRKIDDAVKTFFEKIKDKQYQNVCLALSGDNQKTVFSPSGQCSDTIFLFELSLLTHYDLLNSDSYRVEVKRPLFWTPFIEDRSMRVDIALEGENKISTGKVLSIKNLFDLAKGVFTPGVKSSSHFVTGVLTVERTNGIWEIRDINIDNNRIGPEYAALKERLRLGRYVRETADGFIIEKIEVNTKDLTPVNKRILKYNLQKIQNLIANK